VPPAGDPSGNWLQCEVCAPALPSIAGLWNIPKTSGRSAIPFAAMSAVIWGVGVPIKARCAASGLAGGAAAKAAALPACTGAMVATKAPVSPGAGVVHCAADRQGARWSELPC
jgi:hypothetical protein